MAVMRALTSKIVLALGFVSEGKGATFLADSERTEERTSLRATSASFRRSVEKEEDLALAQNAIATTDAQEKSLPWYRKFITQRNCARGTALAGAALVAASHIGTAAALGCCPALAAGLLAVSCVSYLTDRPAGKQDIEAAVVGAGVAILGGGVIFAPATIGGIKLLGLGMLLPGVTNVFMRGRDS